MIRSLNIPAATYESLSTRERVTAYLAAEARGDSDEAKRLVETCQRKTYQQPDATFIDFLDRLKTAALGVESDLERAALDFLMASRLEEDEDKGPALDAAIRTAAAIVTAWHKVLIEAGMDPADVEAVSPPRHPAVESLLLMGEPEPELAGDGELVDEIAEHLRKILST